MTRNYVNELVRLCLDLAELADTHGEQDNELDFLRELGLGFRAFSRTLRRGVLDIVNLQDRYHREAEKARLCQIGETEAKDFVEEVFGDRDVYMINEKDKQRIREFVRSIEAEWEREEAGESDAYISRETLIERIRGTAYSDAIKENLISMVRNTPAASAPTAGQI
jgi:hypothetical protein